MLLSHTICLCLPLSVCLCPAAGKSTWRVSSTLFGHIQSDQVLAPLEHFSTPAARGLYPAVSTGDQVQSELRMISLAAQE